MPHYQHNVSISRQKRFIRRFKKLILVCVGVIFAIGVAMVVDSFRQSKSHDQTGPVFVTTLAPSIHKFATPYFSFTAASNWTSVSNESTSNKFVYRSFRGKLVEQELKIFINDMAVDLTATRVLPVKINEDRSLLAGEVSEHCSTLTNIKTANGPVLINAEQTKFLCQLDGTNFLVVLGEIGGDTTIRLKRSDGSYATYNFLYRSSTTPPNTVGLIDIIKSFTSL